MNTDTSHVTMYVLWILHVQTATVSDSRDRNTRTNSLPKKAFSKNILRRIIATWLLPEV